MPWRSVKRIIQELKEGGDESNLDPALAQRLMVAIVERVYNLTRIMAALVLVIFVLTLGLQIQVLNIGHTTKNQTVSIHAQKETVEVLRQTVADQGETIQAIRTAIVSIRDTQTNIQESTNLIVSQLADQVERNRKSLETIGPIIASILRTEYAICGGRCPEVPTTTGG